MFSFGIYRAILRFWQSALIGICVESQSKEESSKTAFQLHVYPKIPSEVHPSSPYLTLSHLYPSHPTHKRPSSPSYPSFPYHLPLPTLSVLPYSHSTLSPPLKPHHTLLTCTTSPSLCPPIQHHIWLRFSSHSEAMRAN